MDKMDQIRKEVIGKEKVTVKQAEQTKKPAGSHIFLIGFMGVGKSTAARELKQKLAADCVDMDQMIVEDQGMPVSEIFDTYGEEYFRKLESNTLMELKNRERSIVSCGGGTVMLEENAKLMKQHGHIILLTAEPETIYERVKDSRERPILNGNMNVEFIRSLMEKRRERYEEVADVRVETDGKSVGEICDEIIQRLAALDG